MSQVTVGKWGKNLAIRLPRDIARAAGVTDGQQVEIGTRDGDIIIRPKPADGPTAREAAEEILAEGEKYSLGDVSIRELLGEGRRG